jgi:hypothetical protein
MAPAPPLEASGVTTLVVAVAVVNVPAAGVEPPITAPLIVPDVIAAPALSVFVAIAVAILLYSVS